jgi:hypothetical protein
MLSGRIQLPTHGIPGVIVANTTRRMPEEVEWLTASWASGHATVLDITVTHAQIL